MKVTFLKKKKIIERAQGEPYLIRRNLFECPLFSIKLHKILKSDYDCLHDHPWAFVSLILRGGYVEHREVEVKEQYAEHIVRVGADGKCYKRVSKIYHPGQILFRNAEERHKLEIHQPATTLVFTFKKVRQWGFWTKEGWVPFFEYNSNNTCE